MLSLKCLSAAVLLAITFPLCVNAQAKITATSLCGNGTTPFVTDDNGQVIQGNLMQHLNGNTTLEVIPADLGNNSSLFVFLAASDSRHGSDRIPTLPMQQIQFHNDSTIAFETWNPYTVTILQNPVQTEIQFDPPGGRVPQLNDVVCKNEDGARTCIPSNVAMGFEWPLLTGLFVTFSGCSIQ